jgi:hypothetical protein
VLSANHHNAAWDGTKHHIREGNSTVCLAIAELRRGAASPLRGQRSVIMV